MAEVAAATIAPSDITLQRHADDWLATRDDLSPATAANYRRCLDRLGDLLERPVQRITVRDLDRALAELRRQYAPATAANTRSVLHAALERAVAWELLTTNPLHRTTPTRTKTQTRRTVVALDALQAVPAAEPSTMWRAMWVTLLGTGMRIGECGALAWRHVSLDGAEILVERTITEDAAGRKVIGEATKTRRDRRVPIGPDVVVALKEWRLEVAESGLWRVAPDELVWSSVADQRRPIHPRSVKDAWDKALVRAGVQQVAVGTTRHAHASWLMASGVPAAQVAERLGHGIAQTVRRYGIYQPDGVAQAVVDSLPALNANRAR